MSGWLDGAITALPSFSHSVPDFLVGGMVLPDGGILPASSPPKATLGERTRFSSPNTSPMARASKNSGGLP
jgi:hypothetical protein